MDPKKQRRFQGEAIARGNSIDSTADFDLWAKAVKEQMLSALQKRSKHASDS